MTDDDPSLKIKADRMARAIARLVELRTISSRSEASDAMLDYINVGGLDGPATVPEWINQYDHVPNPSTGECE